MAGLIGFTFGMAISIDARVVLEPSAAPLPVFSPVAILANWNNEPPSFLRGLFLMRIFKSRTNCPNCSIH